MERSPAPTTLNARRAVRLAVLTVAGLFILVLAAPSALADKLVLFKNGKVMRVKDVDTKDGWTRMKIGKNVMGVRSSTILSVEEAGEGGKNSVGASVPNQAAVGGGEGGRGSRGGGRPTPTAAPSPSEPDEPADEPAGDDEAEDDLPPNLKRGFGRNNPGNVRGTRGLRNLNNNQGFNRFRNGRPPNANAAQPSSKLDQRLEERARQRQEEYIQNSNKDDDEDDD